MWFGKVATGLATQGLLVEKQKSEISGKRRKLKPIPCERNNRRRKKNQQQRVNKFRVIFGQKRRASCLPCLSLGLGDDRRNTLRSGDVSLVIFITSVSCSESLRLSLTTSADYQALGWRLMRPKRMEDLAAFSAREVKRAAATEERKRRVVLCRRTVRGKIIPARFHKLHESTAASTWWCRPRLGWVEMAVGFPEGPSYPGHSPFIFSLCCPLNDRRRAAHSIFKIGRLFSLFFLSCSTLALLRLLILLLLLMSGNVHPNPGPIFPCSVCAGNVTWRGKSVQCCTCSKWVHLRCSQIFLSNFRALGSSTNLFRLASLLALLVGLNLFFLISALLWSFKITKVVAFESVEVFRKDPFLALYYSLSSLMIFRLFCLLPSAALFTLTIWPFVPPPTRSPLRWRPHKELCFDWSAGLSTGVFLSIRANVILLLSGSPPG